MEGSKAVFLGRGDKGTGGGEGAGVTVDAGQAGTEHGGKGGAEDEPTGPFADGFGIEGDQLLRECHAAGRKRLTAAKKDEGTQREKTNREYSGHAVAKEKIELGFANGGGMPGLFFTTEHPKGGPDRKVDRGGHPSEEADEKCEAGPSVGTEGRGRRGGLGLVEECEEYGGKGTEGEQKDEGFGEAVEEAVATQQDKSEAKDDDAESKGRDAQRDAAPGEEGPREHTDGRDVDGAGKDVDGEEDPYAGGAFAVVAVEKAFAGRGGVALPIEEEGHFEEIGGEDQPEERPAEFGTGAGRPDEVRTANCGTGDKQAGAEGLAQI